MKNCKKNYLFLFIILSILFLPFSVKAATASVTDDVTLRYLLTNGKSGTTIIDKIIINADITLTKSPSVKNELTIDLNGYTIDTAAKTLVFRDNSNITIKDTSSSKTGKITGTSRIIQTGYNGEKGTLNFESGTIEGTLDTMILNSGTLNLNGGTIRGNNIVVLNTGNLVVNSGYIIGETNTIENQGSIEMNGGELRSNEGVVIQSQTDSLNVINGGLIITTAPSTAVNLSKEGASMIMTGGTIDATVHDSTTGGAGVMGFKNTEVTISGGTINAYSLALGSNGGQGANAKFNISGGTLTSSNDTCIYVPQENGEVNISGGTISGLTGIEIRAGKLTMTDGTINGTNETYSVTPNGSGTTTLGSAIAVVQHITKLPIEINITGGTLNAVVPFSEANPQGNDREYIDLIEMNIDNSSSELTMNGSDPIMTVFSEDFDSFIKGGLYTTSVESYLADGYGEIEENNMIRVVPFYTIIIEGDGKDYITLSQLKAPYNQEITIQVSKKNKVLLEVKDVDGNEIALNNNKFNMPKNNVIIKATLDINNPPTGDNIIKYIITFLLCIFMMVKLYKRKTSQ